MANASSRALLNIAGPLACQITLLRLRAPDPARLAALGKSLGLSWPMAINTVAHGQATVLQVAPAEWAIAGIDPAVSAHRASEMLAGLLYHLADISDGNVCFQIGGARSRDLLAKGCSLDLHQRVFLPATCARTRFAQLHALLHRPSEGDCFDLYVDATTASYLGAWLKDAAAEFINCAAHPSLRDR